MPGARRGGWHDAGDWDMRVESQADTIYGLALAWELFHVDYDNTSIDQKTLVTEIHQPDGKPDVLQQLEHGVLSVVGGYESLGRLYRGIIEPTLRQYVFLGDGALMTDNVVFDPKKTPEASAPAVGLPGSPDDRWVFTEENPRRELLTAASLAAASRALKGYNDDLAARSLKAAIAIYDRATPQDELARVGAATELFITTQDPKYRRLLLAQRDAIAQNIERVGWMVGRTLPLIKDAAYTKAIRDAVAAYRLKVDALAKETPYAVPYKPDIWGAGWNIQRFGWDQWMLHLSFPDLFPRTYALQALIIHSRRTSGFEHRLVRVGRGCAFVDHGLWVQPRRLVAHPGRQRFGHRADPSGFSRAQDLAFLLAADRIRARPRHHRLSIAGAGGGSRAERAMTARARTSAAGSRASRRSSCRMKPIANSMLNMLLNLPANITSVPVFTHWSHHCGHNSLPSRPEKNEVLNHGMFMMKLPSSANPRITSSV